MKRVSYLIYLKQNIDNTIIQHALVIFQSFKKNALRKLAKKNISYELNTISVNLSS